MAVDDIPGVIRDEPTEDLQKLRRDTEAGPQSDRSRLLIEVIDEVLTERGVSPKLH